MATATPGILGRINEFDINGNEKFTEYIERLTQYFYANDITDDKKQTAVFLTVIGQDTYSLLRSLLTPTAPHTKSVAQLGKILSDHLVPKPIVIAERHKFYEATQHQGEHVKEYIARLRRMTEFCEFGNFLEEALRDKFVCGLRSHAIRKQLLSNAI